MTRLLLVSVAAAATFALLSSAAAQPVDPVDVPLPDPAPPDPTPTPDPLAEEADIADTPAAGEDVPGPKPDDEPPRSAKVPLTRHTSAEVADAPKPGQAPGIERPPEDGQGWRVVPRTLLYVPRGVLWLVDAPFRGSLYLYERYRLRDRWKAIFFNDEGTFGIFPIATYESGFGINAGVSMVHRDLFGDDEDLSLRASFGGRFRQEYSGKFTTGDRLGRTRLELEGEYEIRPKDRFFGIGNNDLADDPPAMPIDPYTDPRAFDARFRQRMTRASGIIDVRLIGDLSVRGSAAFLRRRFGDASEITSSDFNLEEVYDTAAIPRFDDGTSYVYNELELRLDTRHNHLFEPPSVPSHGWFLSAYGGLVSGVDQSYQFGRYGFEGQRFIRLAPSPRAVILRLTIDGVTGELDEIPFTELPRLGGPLLLRGYERDRFRDRVAAMGSAEYQWDLLSTLSGFVFVDAGRVYRRLRDVELEDLRVGFGGGIEAHLKNTFLGRAQITSSTDGGILLQFSLDPIYDLKARVKRR